MKPDDTNSPAENVRRFALVVSHDLQEPLRMVLTYSQLLERRLEGQLDAEASEILGYVRQGAERMRTLIADLLEYSRALNGPPPTRPVKTEGALVSALFSLQAYMQEHGAEVTYDPMPEAWADDAQLSQVFQHLIENAIKFRAGDRPPRIHVTIGELEPAWLCCVSDNGIGLEMDFSEQVFEPFQRLHPRSRFEGTGVGLTIARKIVERHGGKIWLESEPGKGTRVYFTLPKEPGEGEAQ